MTAVSNRPQSFPLSLSHSSAVSFNLDKNKEHQPSSQPCPQVPPRVTPQCDRPLIPISLRRERRDFNQNVEGPHDRLVMLFCYFILPSAPSAVNKRDSTARLSLWLSPTWVDCHVSGWGGQITEPKDLSKCSHHIKSGIEHIVVRQPGY